MREIRQSGSVRGVRSNLYPYRDLMFWLLIPTKFRCPIHRVLCDGWEPIHPTNKKARILIGPGRRLQDRLRLTHLPLTSQTDGSTPHAHTHGQDRNSVFACVQHGNSIHSKRRTCQISSDSIKKHLYDNVVICNNLSMKTIRPRTSRVFTISFPEDLAKQVVAVAEEESRNISELFREAFRAYRLERIHRMLDRAHAEAAARGPVPYTVDDVEAIVDEIRSEHYAQRKLIA